MMGYFSLIILGPEKQILMIFRRFRRPADNYNELT